MLVTEAARAGMQPLAQQRERESVCVRSRVLSHRVKTMAQPTVSFTEWPLFWPTSNVTSWRQWLFGTLLLVMRLVCIITFWRWRWNPGYGSIPYDLHTQSLREQWAWQRQWQKSFGTFPGSFLLILHLCVVTVTAVAYHMILSMPEGNISILGTRLLT